MGAAFLTWRGEWGRTACIQGRQNRDSITFRQPTTIMSQWYAVPTKHHLLFQISTEDSSKRLLLTGEKSVRDGKKPQWATCPVFWPKRWCIPLVGTFDSSSDIPIVSDSEKL
jgi:hypothetical protein